MPMKTCNSSISKCGFLFSTDLTTQRWYDILCLPLQTAITTNIQYNVIHDSATTLSGSKCVHYIITKYNKYTNTI